MLEGLIGSWGRKKTIQEENNRHSSEMEKKGNERDLGGVKVATAAIVGRGGQ